MYSCHSSVYWLIFSVGISVLWIYSKLNPTVRMSLYIYLFLLLFGIVGCYITTGTKRSFPIVEIETRNSEKNQEQSKIPPLLYNVEWVPATPLTLQDYPLTHPSRDLSIPHKIYSLEDFKFHVSKYKPYVILVYIIETCN